MNESRAELRSAYEDAHRRETAIRKEVNAARGRLSAASRERYAIGRRLDKAIDAYCKTTVPAQTPGEKEQE